MPNRCQSRGGMKKILIVHASFGQGHTRAAEALAAYFDAECVDILDFCPVYIKRAYQQAYIYTTQHVPWLWRAAFVLSRVGVFAFLLHTAHHILFASFKRYVRKARPAALIATHFYPAHILGGIQQELACTIIALVTDMCAHPLWYSRHIDWYVVPSVAAAEDLKKYGVGAERVHVGYVALREGFRRKISADWVRKKLGLDHRPCVMCMSSVQGQFPFLKETLPELARKYNVLVVCGSNTVFKQYLDRLGLAGVWACETTEEPWELLSIASVIVAKPGGMTIFEGAYLRKPFVFTHYIPGQEEENMKFLIRHGVARFCASPKDFVDAVQNFCGRGASTTQPYPVLFKDAGEIIGTLL